VLSTAGLALEAVHALATSYASDKGWAVDRAVKTKDFVKHVKHVLDNGIRGVGTPFAPPPTVRRCDVQLADAQLVPSLSPARGPGLACGDCY